MVPLLMRRGMSLPLDFLRGVGETVARVMHPGLSRMSLVPLVLLGLCILVLSVVRDPLTLLGLCFLINVRGCGKAVQENMRRHGKKIICRTAEPLCRCRHLYTIRVVDPGTVRKLTSCSDGFLGLARPEKNDCREFK